MSVTMKRWQFTFDEYHRMGEVGILHEDDRVELIEGELIEMPPIGGGHMGSVIDLTRLFSRRAGDAALVSVQNPVRLPPGSEPRPDIVLLRPRPDSYRGGPPGPEDVLLLVEVADTTLAYDRDVKAPLYARAGIVEVWIVDLQGQRVTVYREPGEAGYHQVTVHEPGATLAPLALPDVTITVDEILG